MNKEKLQNVCKLLDFLGKKEHIFLMSDDEYKKEFNWVFTKETVGYTSLQNENGKHPAVVASIIFNGITFHVLNPEFESQVV